MTPKSEPSRLFDAERRAETQRAAIHERETRRSAGVAWSGLAPDPFQPRSVAAMARDAAERLARLQHWRASRSGRLLAAMAAAERAVEAIRAGVARGLETEADHTTRALLDLEAAALAARRAMDGTSPRPLSEEPCATNSASPNR
jgi:hypothetical protein